MTGSRLRRRHPGRVAVATVSALTLGGAVAVANGFGLSGDDDGGQAVGGLPPATAKVLRQTLVDTQTVSGDLDYGTAKTVAGRAGGTVTALPAIGSTLRRGSSAYRVDDAPVVLLYGALPAYRALSRGTKGADVKQFEQNLYALGYRGFVVDSTYSRATAKAVKQWQDDLGLQKTGTVSLGRVVYAAGPVRVDAHKLAVGEGIQAGAAVLTYTGTSRVVTVKLKMSERRLARTGATVKITLPDGRTVAGRIARVESVVETAGGDGDGADQPVTKVRVTVTVSGRGAFTALDQATADVGFTASARKGVLTVPVAALLALAEGGYGVQVVTGTSTRIVAVRTGMFAAGRVEITGQGLSDGATVGVPA